LASLDGNKIDRLASVAFFEGFRPSGRMKKRIISIPQQERIPIGVFNRVNNFKLHECKDLDDEFNPAGAFRQKKYLYAVAN